MATFAALKSEVADDLSGRGGTLSSQIATAILDAIEFHSAERFWWNETRAYTFATVGGQTDYTLPLSGAIAEFIKIDWLRVTIGVGNDYLLERDRPIEFEDSTLTTTQGQPTSYTYYGDTFRLYPTPDQAYTVRVAGHFRLVALSADGDENGWTNDARNLIRATARKYLYGRIIREPNDAAIAEQDELRELDRLRREMSRRGGTGIIKPWV